MRLYLADEIHRYLHHDQKRGTAENKRNRQLGNQNFRQNAERGQISGAKHGQAGKDIVKIFGRVFARTDAGDKTACEPRHARDARDRRVFSDCQPFLPD